MTYTEKGFPVSCIWQDAFYAANVPTWMPAVAYNPPTGKFFVTWRETPVPGPNSMVQVNHIRGEWIDRQSLNPNSPNFVLSATNGGEDPQYPAVASSTQNGDVLVVWADMRNFTSDSTDIYGTIFTIEVPVPIQLSSFKARPTGNSSVVLEWTTLSEVNNYGFEIQRRPEGDPKFTTLPGVFIPGHGTTIVPQRYSYTDATASGGRWWYRLRQMDLGNSVHYSEPVPVDIVTGVKEAPVPTAFVLHQNYPNPCNPSTTIKYELPRASYVTLTVYDVLGREVATLVNGIEEPGYKSVQWDASGVASGIYFYRLQAGDFVATKKLLLIR
jgi:hypothetical protein